MATNEVSVAYDRHMFVICIFGEILGSEADEREAPLQHTIFYGFI